MDTSHPAFNGTGQKIVLAFDVGTTYSGISYRYVTLQAEANGCYRIGNSMLDPGVVPEIKGVTR